MKEWEIDTILRKMKHLEERSFKDGTGNKVNVFLHRIKKEWYLEITNNYDKFREKYTNINDVIDTILQYLVEDDIKQIKLKQIL